MQSELKKRILSAAVLAPLALGVVYVGGAPFMVLMFLCFVLMYQEWTTITRSAPKRWKWSVWGAIYIGQPCLTLIQISNSGQQKIIFFIIAIVWATDIGAYFFGRAIGGPKLAPKISPKKTWAGLLGGILCAELIALPLAGSAMKHMDNIVAILMMAAIVATLAVVAQMGDLYESWIKRKFGVKDSGSIIPGHGGLLDRLDGLLSVTWAVGFLISVWPS